MAGYVWFDFAARPCDPKPIGAKGAALRCRNAASTEVRLTLAQNDSIQVPINSIEGDESCVPLK
jgi:hypothetical protein